MPMISKWSRIFWTYGSIRAARTASCSKAGVGPICNGPLIFILKAVISIAAGSNHRCCKAAPRVAARPMIRFSPTASPWMPRARRCRRALANTIDPLKVMEQYGADIIRLWALSVDFTEDHRIGDEILKGVGDQYRKLRNTFRYLLGALDGFVGDMGDTGEVPELEIYVLAMLADLDGKLRKAVDDYDYNAYTRHLVDFCNEDLSAFFFDIRKDSLYCDGADSTTRNAYRTVLDLLFHALIRYAAPVLVYTAEEVWEHALSRWWQCPPARMARRSRCYCRWRKMAQIA